MFEAVLAIGPSASLRSTEWISVGHHGPRHDCPRCLSQQVVCNKARISAILRIPNKWATTVKPPQVSICLVERSQMQQFGTNRLFEASLVPSDPKLMIIDPDDCLDSFSLEMMDQSIYRLSPAAWFDCKPEPGSTKTNGTFAFLSFRSLVFLCPLL
jgi:hypothetical protein